MSGHQKLSTTLAKRKQPLKNNSDQYHAVCNECGGKGCDECHSGWQCTMEDIGKCNKCDMGWELGKKDD